MLHYTVRDILMSMRRHGAGEASGLRDDIASRAEIEGRCRIGYIRAMPHSQDMHKKSGLLISPDVVEHRGVEPLTF